MDDPASSTAAIRFAFHEAQARRSVLEAVRAWRRPAHRAQAHPLLVGNSAHETPTSSAGSKASELTYKVVYTLFAITGSLLTLQTLIDMADAVLFMLAVINIIGLYLLSPVVKRELNSFLEFVRARNAGEIPDDDEDQESVKTTV